MICIIAGNYEEAWRWARGQMLDKSEWFYPKDYSDLDRRENFHVIVVGSAGQNTSPILFENLLQHAHTRGRQNRK